MREYELRPLSLIQDIPYHYREIQDEKEKRLAWVTRPTEQFPFHEIVMNEARAKALYEQSWARDVMSFETYRAVVVFHEVCHVVFKTFEYQSSLLEQNCPYPALYHYVDNVLEDSRIEHFGSIEWSIYTRPLDHLLGSLRWSFELPGGEDDEEKEESLAQKQIYRHLKTLFYLARFGIIHEDSDEQFLAFLFSLVITSKRMGRKDFLLAPDAVYMYLEKIAETDKEHFRDQLAQGTCTLVPISKEEAEALARSASVFKGDDGQEQGNIQVIESSILDALRDEMERQRLSLAGHGNTTVHVDTKQNTFVQQTIARFPDEITELCQAFRLLFERYREVSAYDGELSIEHMQQAYLNSLSGDEDLDYYLIWQKMIPDLDVVVIRDISLSTAGMEKAFAIATVLLHVAMKQVPGVRSMDIVFSDDAEIDKLFDDDIEASGIKPRHVYGTYFVAPLELIQKEVQFRAAKKLALVITDGDFAEGDHWSLVEELQEAGVQFLLVEVHTEGSDSDVESIEPVRYLGPFDMPLYRTTVKALPAFFYAMIRYELFRRLR